MTDLQVLSLSPKHQAARILHLTDTHLFADDDAELLGVATNASFQAVINEIRLQQQPFDLIVATGDLVQARQAAAYQRFIRQIQVFNKPCVWVPGNHDDRPMMQQLFKAAGLAEQKVVLIGEQWLLILLDSQVVGHNYGELDAAQLALIEQAIALYPERQALLFLHHHPVLTQCRWLDQHALQNRQQLAELVQRYAAIIAVICGHIHQVLSSYWQQCQILSTPSTCIQFKPRCDEFTLEMAAPGWRLLELYADGTFASTVHYLSDNRFRPDLSQTGY